MEIISIPPWEINWTYFSLQVHTLTWQTQIMEFYASYNYGIYTWAELYIQVYE